MAIKFTARDEPAKTKAKDQPAKAPATAPKDAVEPVEGSELFPSAPKTPPKKRKSRFS